MKAKAIFSAMISLILTIALLGVSIPGASAHCQIPCGIYDHQARVDLMLEHIGTIEKSVKKSTELSGKTDAKSQNQLIRWVNNKEQHAQKIQDIISTYFLAQVVKPADPNNKSAYKAYLQKLADHHAVIVAAMKTKQTVDLEKVKALRQAVEELNIYYQQ